MIKFKITDCPPTYELNIGDEEIDY